MLNTFAVIKGGQKKSLRMRIPASVGFYHGFLQDASACIAKSNEAMQDSEKVRSLHNKQMAKSYAECALECAKAALMFNPSSSLAYKIKSNSLLNLGKLRQSLAPLGMAMALATRPEEKAHLFVLRGKTFYHLHDYPRAIAEYEKALSTKNDFNTGIIKVLVGGCYVCMGELDKGVSMMRKGYSAEPISCASKADKISWELASSTVGDFMLAISGLLSGMRTKDARSLEEAWRAWRNL